MGTRFRRPLHRLAFWAAACATFSGALAVAHERFIKHNLLHPVDPNFFIHNPDIHGIYHPHPGGSILGVDNNIWRIGLNTFVIMTAFLIIWFVRNPLADFIQYRLLVGLTGAPQRYLHYLACFVTDRPIRTRTWATIREWVTIFFLRSPSLVLVYSATQDSLVMPSYPLDPASASIFKFAQVGLAILIFTQTALPLCGAMIIGTWFYLFRWGWMVAVDAMPVLTVAVLYLTAPWQSHKVAITNMNPLQTKYLRLVLGVGFLALGYLKLYNYNLTAAVADNYPSVLKDPMVQLLTAGTGPGYERERWVVAFGAAEILSGFLLMIGVFSRIWASIMTFMFVKLMLVDFGFAEIPHIYPIGAMMMVITSNNLESVLVGVENRNERMVVEGKKGGWLAGVTIPAVAVAFLVIFPVVLFISLFDRSSL